MGGPGPRLAGGLLTFASADRVYATYVQAFVLLFPAVLLCAWVVRSERPPHPARVERWGWRVALSGYAVMTLGLATAFVVLIAGSPSGDLLNGVFLGLFVPGMLLGTFGSTALGIALLRARYAPRLTAWLLALSLPLWILRGDVLGHNSIGLVPLLVAWAVTGRRLRSGASVGQLTSPSAAASSRTP